MFRVRVKLEGIEEALDRLKSAIDGEVKSTLIAIADAVGHTAQQTHPWQNRTGDLQAGTRGENVTWNDLWSGRHLYAEVVGDTEYGSYLEAKPQWAWLMPAWLANEPFADADMEAALDRAYSAAGW